MCAYSPFRSDSYTPITVEIFKSRLSVSPHRHSFYEFVLVTQGSCIHRYKKEEVLLLPGDVFLLPARQEHSFQIDDPVTVYNCQFFLGRLDPRWHPGNVSKEKRTIVQEETWRREKPIEEHLDSILRSVAIGRETGKKTAHRPSISGQGIIHLNVEERSMVQGVLEAIRDEQEQKRIGFEHVKQAYLEFVLVLLRRVQMRQFPEAARGAFRKQKTIGQAVRYMENNIAEDIDFAKYAADNHVSPSHFRAVFKEATGLSPLNYLNRLRITRALELLRSGEVRVAQAAAEVGILDANYFSRLFKKVTGHTPRESMSGQSDLLARGSP
jgi:AraC-like DNA-binding protein